ncbi:double-strand-break repair protein rad21-like protein 1 [Latimeria chalumnae]|uniref:double-strand-break repair protein rad21-like protein 1 n=1 Tax=Latimeria chalumnae TaxID=7897 RepID=UPI0003C1882A|nr:PREDICTED: double-strand-break repair protein rad21-like protein 1 [Latimeria chalumnae]XP_014348288.1 PREDICTED: double-strand-break repair protein rad21-like protein 1 [Latimeria chalumnae]|eukprot:XP_006003239.1 PREDICTED: double-strand-break repair protein rad21-like protein 1 [Latimeria chalumnae]
MFYAHLLLSKRGPLAKIWLAAHWEKKLTKVHVFECNLETTVDSIISPAVKIALRTSGHLLLGVVRIYHRKAKYLLADCNETFVKIKLAFRPGLVDLPEENMEASYNTITLPEEFFDFETQLPDLKAIDVVDHFSLNQSRAEEITLREEYSPNILVHDDHFGEEVELLRQDTLFGDNMLMNISDSLLPDSSLAATAEERFVLYDGPEGLKNDGFGDEGVTDLLENFLTGKEDGLFLDILTGNTEVPSAENVPAETLDMEKPCDESVYSSQSHPIVNETTLLSNIETAFALNPVDATITSSSDKPCSKKKRKLVVDSKKELNSDAIREQISDPGDTVTTVDLAPPTKNLMLWKESGRVKTLLKNPSQFLIHSRLHWLFTRCLHSSVWRCGRQDGELELNMEALRTEQEVIDMAVAEERSEMQESVGSDSCRETNNETMVPTALHSRNRKTSTHQQAAENVLETMQVDLPSEESLLKNGSNGQGMLLERTEELTGEVMDPEKMKSNKKTIQMLNILRKHYADGMCFFSLFQLCHSNSRRQASTKLYSFLVLKRQSALDLTQEEPYTDIIATPGVKFHVV